MRVAVCVGKTDAKTMKSWFAADGLKRPFVVATMDKDWWRAARAMGVPRFFFKCKIDLMQFALGHHIVCIEAVDGTKETASMGASMFAMNAVSIPIAGERQEGGWV